MKILLINNNPVVSRLTALSARKEGVELDEIKDISELKNSDYNIVFVDLDSFSENIANVLKNSDISKKVCFYTQDDKNIDEIFNFEILKPFLPSEVSAIIRETKIEQEEEQKETDNDEHINLDELISNKKDDLEPIDIEQQTTDKDSSQDEILNEINIAKEQIEELKKDAIKEIDQPTLKNEEDSKVEKTKEIKEESITTNENKENDINNELFELEENENNNKKQNDDELFTLDIEETKEKDEDELFKFDLESEEEVIFDSIEQKEDNDTKILDKDEISNIKHLLNDETPDDLSLEDIMTPPTTPLALADTDIKKKKKKKKKRKKTKEIKTTLKDEEIKIGTEVITETIKAMPVEELRQLLRGTKIHITIEFPNE